MLHGLNVGASNSTLQRPGARAARAAHGRFHPVTLVSRFGSWNGALERAGLRVTKRQAIPSDELIADLRWE